MLATGKRETDGWTNQHLGQGFTLIEALVVVALLAMVGGLAFPRIETMIHIVGLSSARVVLAGAVNEVRAEAIMQDSEATLMVSPDGGKIFVDGKTVAELPGGVSIVPHGSSIVFYGDGSASGGTFTLTSKVRTATFRIASGTGISRWIQ